MLKFYLAQIKEGHSTIVVEANPSEVDLHEHPEFVNPLRVCYTVDRVGDEIFVKTRLQTSVQLTCDRCLEPYLLNLDEVIDAVMTHDDKLASREEEDIYLINKSTREVDITESVRQTLLLAIPYKKLCREDCKGLCPRCGANLNTAPCTCDQTKRDPRWDALRNLNFE